MRHYLTNVLKPYYDKFFRLFIATFCGTSEEEKCMREIWYIATRGFR